MKSAGINSDTYLSYAIIDDRSDILYDQRKNFFQTDWDHGLSPSVRDEVIKYLNAFK